jgi:hypothetical protein
MNKVYHPEVDVLPLCTEDDSAKHRSIIGCCIWIIVLGRFDTAYATFAMSRFNMLHREGDPKVVKRSFPISRHFQRGGSSLTPHTLTIPCILLRTIQIRRNYILILEKKF